MTRRYTRHTNPKQTPQNEPIPGESQVKNSAGGYAYQLDDFGRLMRFLILGNEGGTYYATERKLTLENAECVLRCANSDAEETVRRIANVSVEGRAPKNDPAIFALALIAGKGTDEARKLALEAVPQVCRIGTHLFQFAEAVQTFRGWGRGLRRAVADWYARRGPDALAYQMVKYRQRGGWSHEDLLRKAHAPGRALAESLNDNAVLRWVLKSKRHPYEVAELPNLVQGFIEIQNCKTEKEVLKILAQPQYPLPWEAVPSEFLKSPDVWEALLPNMKTIALTRNLGRLGAIGLLKPLSDTARVVARRLEDATAVRESRIHPVGVLSALGTYSQGHGVRGDLSWTPVPQIKSALDEMFYLAFGNVEPSGKRTLLALDVSGSMGSGTIAGTPGVTPAMGAAAMAMVAARTEPDYYVMGFADTFRDLNITKSDTLETALRKAQYHNFGRTSCAVPMLWAQTQRLEVDTFVVYTDNETWIGRIHPSQALRQYREIIGTQAKLVVVGMTATEFSIANPKDAGMLDVVGFDTAAPNLIADFSRGSLEGER